jgi:hypothetical protein
LIFTNIRFMHIFIEMCKTNIFLVDNLSRQMNKLKKLLASRSTAFKSSLGYVGLGTLSVCSIYPKDLLYGDWSLYGLLFGIDR